MASLESLLTRQYSAQSMSGRVIDNGCIGLEIVFAPTYTLTSGAYVADATFTSITVVTAATLTLINSGETIVCDLTDADPTTTTTGSTLGGMVDNINKSKYFRARVIDGLRAEATQNAIARVTADDGAITGVDAGGETLYRVYLLTDVVDAVYYRVAADRGVLNNDAAQPKDQIAKGGHRVKVAGIKYNQNISAAENGAVRIYEFDPINLTETLIWALKSVDATDTSIDFSLNPITSGEGKELVVMVMDTTSITDDAANFLQVDYIRE